MTKHPAAGCRNFWGHSTRYWRRSRHHSSRSREFWGRAACRSEVNCWGESPAYGTASDLSPGPSPLRASAIRLLADQESYAQLRPVNYRSFSPSGTSGSGGDRHVPGRYPRVCKAYQSHLARRQRCIAQRGRSRRRRSLKTVAPYRSMKSDPFRDQVISLAPWESGGRGDRCGGLG
jgi:hypothetical protein